MSTSIEWTDVTWNPTRGCSRVSEGCRNCYAERTAARGLPGMNSPTTGEPFARMRRLPAVGGRSGCSPAPRSANSGDGDPQTGTAGSLSILQPSWTGKVELIEAKLQEPLHWRKPRRVFVNSMSDLFHEALPDEAIDRVFAVMALCPHLTFQVLTKRAERAYAWANAKFGAGHRGERITELMMMWTGFPQGRGFPRYVEAWPLPNVWLGVSVEDQPTADARIPLLLQTPAALRFVSYEPGLAAVDFDSDHVDGLHAL